ncbi:hypothetical protein [Streptomyces sp. GESEQ-35]|uniref:hypothetical protein n=1 Tax=Streptomyces sp. GESEQ-35 TaxID=2812657 RepID=UPI001B33A72E|nr:hypothetical protein [Streptomyces sp. GESEQ-35]
MTRDLRFWSGQPSLAISHLPRLFVFRKFSQCPPLVRYFQRAGVIIGAGQVSPRAIRSTLKTLRRLYIASLPVMGVAYGTLVVFRWMW